ASWLDEAEVAECRETFRAFDKDGNGFFDRSELGTVLASAGRVCEAEQLQMAMDRISGVVGTARVTFEEFSALFRAKLDVSLEARAQRRFSLFDKHKSGEIDLAELRACIQSVDDLVTGAEVEEMLRACDVDGNGQVSLEEFVAMM
ncbi:calmodulin mutant SYNCAM64B, partial [Lophium mytilinum]